MYTNCDQLSNKQDELLLLVETEKPDLICLTEVLPKSYSSFDRFVIPGFILFDNFDTKLSRDLPYRGVCIYVAAYLQSSEVTIHSELVEHLWIKIKLQNNNFLLVGCIYRSPSLSKFAATTDLCQIIESACDLKSQYVLITGDFNYSNIDWINGTTLSENLSEILFLDTIQDHVLYQHITEPTHYRIGTEPHLLDLVLTNDEGMVVDMAYLHGLGKSDHICLVFNLICCPIRSYKCFASFNFKEADFNKLVDLLQSVDWYHVLEPLDASQAWDKFTCILNEFVQLTIPQQTKRSNKINPYINSKVLKLKRKKQFFWREYCISGSHYDYCRFARVRNDLRSLTRSLRSNYEKKLMENVKQNPQLFWKYVRSKVKVKHGISSLVDGSGSVATADLEKVEVLNNYFSSVFTHENLDSIPVFDDLYHGEPLEKFDISTDQVYQRLRELKSNKSPGPDGLHPRILKETANAICVPLTIIFKKSIHTAIIPNDWRTANLVYLFIKKVNITNLETIVL